MCLAVIFTYFWPHFFLMQMLTHLESQFVITKSLTSLVVMLEHMRTGESDSLLVMFMNIILLFLLGRFSMALTHMLSGEGEYFLALVPAKSISCGTLWESHLILRCLCTPGYGTVRINCDILEYGQQSCLIHSQYMWQSQGFNLQHLRQYHFCSLISNLRAWSRQSQIGEHWLSFMDGRAMNEKENVEVERMKIYHIAELGWYW